MSMKSTRSKSSSDEAGVATYPSVARSVRSAKACAAIAGTPRRGHAGRFQRAELQPPHARRARVRSRVDPARARAALSVPPFSGFAAEKEEPFGRLTPFAGETAMKLASSSSRVCASSTTRRSGLTPDTRHRSSASSSRKPASQPSARRPWHSSAASRVLPEPPSPMRSASVNPCPSSQSGELGKLRVAAVERARSRTGACRGGPATGGRNRPRRYPEAGAMYGGPQ